MPPPKRRYDLIIADKPYEIDWPTYTMDDPDPGFDARLLTCTRHSMGRCGAGGTPFAPAHGLSGNVHRMRPRHAALKERSLAVAQAAVKQFVIHLDGCANAEMCFNVLHNERGLSCHFIIDNDGTIYQTLDLIDCGYHAAGLNETSIGVEICNRGDAKKDPDFYDQPGRTKRDVVACSINDSRYVAYDFTKPQYDAMDALGKALAKYLPGIKLDYPQVPGMPGQQHWGTLYPGDEAVAANILKASYSGYLGHYHITTRKWDPGPFDFRKYLTKAGGKRSFPIGLHGKAKAEVPTAPPLSAPERSDYLSVFQDYYDNNEIEGAGGFFPVGPLDHYQLYHGGIHLHAEKGTPIVAPFAGSIILARNGPAVLGIGSTNFILIQHSQKIGADQLNFYTLFFHVGEEKSEGKKGERLKWMMGDGWDAAEPGKVTVLDPPERVQAGDVIGHVGAAGPEGEPQLHWEIFTLEHKVVENNDKLGFWKVYSGATDQRYCTNKDILNHIESKKDGVITQEELMDHFRGDPATREWTHAAVTYHYSEWSERPDWKLALAAAPEYKRKPLRAREIDEMYEEQILPTIWWRDDVAQKIKLPQEPRVYTYHPVSFLRWLNDLVGTREVEVTRKATKADYDAATSSKAQLDIDDKDGTSFVSESDLVAVPPQQQLQLPDLIDGYGD